MGRGATIVVPTREDLFDTYSLYSAVGGRTYLQSATIEQSNVISLKIHRPKYFK